MAKHYRREPRFVSIVSVHFESAESLIDMFRYDRCVPATEDDARKIIRTMSETTIVAADHVVQLIRYAANDLPATDGRWRSFGCRVLDERSPEAPPITEAEVLNLARVMR